MNLMEQDQCQSMVGHFSPQKNTTYSAFSVPTFLLSLFLFGGYIGTTHHHLI